MSKRMFYIQIAGEALIPLFGYFLWDWSLYFIILFYLADMLINEVILHLKSRKINNYDAGKSLREWLIVGSVSLALLILSVIVIHIAIRSLHPQIEFVKEALVFWKYEEMGIQQGYILLPLLIVMAYQRYKMEFLFTARYRTESLKSIWIKHLKAFPVIIAGSGLCIGLSTFYVPGDLIVLLTIIGFSSLYRLVYR